MPQGSILLDGLAESDRAWVFETAIESSLQPGDALISEGRTIDRLHFVLSGFLEVSVSTLGRLAAIGAGEIVGEMSFVERQPAVASVTAPEGASILSLQFADLDAKIARDDGFAGRWYQGIARLISRRHRLSIGKGEPDCADTAAAVEGGKKEIPEWWRPVAESAARFVETCGRGAAETGPPGTAFVDELRGEMESLSLTLNQAVASVDASNALVRDDLGRRLREELAPHLAASNIIKRILDRPRGIAADYLTLQAILEKTATGRSGLGPALDRAFLDLPLCDAFRERAKMIEERIFAAARDRREPLHVTCLAAGPADELFEVYRRLKKLDLLKTTLIDLDSQAILYMSGKRDNRFLDPHMKLCNENVLYLAAGRSRLTLPPQDIVYSLNLLGSVEDGPAAGILDFMRGLLKPGGAAILGTFLPENPSRGFMDYLLEWRLLHRSVEAMNNLFARSNFGRASSRIRMDERRITALAECVR